MNQVILPPEWTPQSAVQLTWPHKDTDWRDNLDEVTACFTAIAKEIIKRETLLIVCKNEQEVKAQFKNMDFDRIIFREMETNDTWARDHGAISVIQNGRPVILDFTFNGWGLKFAANWDNQITRRLYETDTFSPETGYLRLPLVLEGGSIESDGAGTILTTTKCLLSPNRNESFSPKGIELFLKQTLGANRILWLNNGQLAGDDTDGHIDTLARFCDPQTIAYVCCENPEDEHYKSLSAMKKELEDFRTVDGKPYCLIPLPMADAVQEAGQRLPATYANFLIINGAVLMPVYDSPQKDAVAAQQLQKAFPDREIVTINCLPLIRQGGSLHCATMQFPKNVL